MTWLFNVVLRLKPLQWQKILEDLRSIKGILSKVQSKEYCITTHLFARRVLSLVRRSGFMSTALYLKQCSSSLLIAHGGDCCELELSSVPVSLNRRRYPSIIPAFHCRVIYGGGHRADECVRFYLSIFSLYRLVILAKKISKNTFEPFITPIKDMDRVLSFIEARFCLNLRGRRRSGSPATTSVNPTKSLNLAVVRSLISDSLATTSMKNLSKICFLIGDSRATTFRDPTLLSNMAARLIGTPVGSSCIQILWVPGSASTKNISSHKRKTSDCKAFPLHKKKLELDLGNA
ncbi:hypothetical protein C1H46_042494 [Malus baccata]|uniref:Uncharacterized protein n=1 Tax=Malus baccata TaxID=106549 RepID=A0A540KCL8_MALBA|nr:hypothetical protein C1H46_042494 [Malus baccata]